MPANVDLIGIARSKNVSPRSLQNLRGYNTTGRRTCRRCKCWRLRIDFKVHTWADAECTRPQRLMPDCDTCRRGTVKRRNAAYKDRRRELRRIKREARLFTEEFEQRRVSAIVDGMPRDQRFEYELEGCLAITVCGITVADEDRDPRPIPTGCHRCWRTGTNGAGEAYINCPDADVKNTRRDDIRSRRLTLTA